MLFFMLQLINVQLFSKYEIEQIRIKTEYREIILKKKDIKKPYYISLNPKSSIEINSSIKRTYKGTIKIFKKNEKIIIINRIKLHDYIIRVIASELGSDQSEEIIRAFYLVIKSYTINNLKKHKSIGADLCDITHCQLYYGEKNNLKHLYNVTDDLKDKYICYKNKIIEAYYSTICGPYTIDPSLIWKKRLPYLKSKSNIYKGHFLASTHKDYKWKAVFNKKKILKMFSLNKLKIKKKVNNYVLELGDNKKTIKAQDFKRKIGHAIYWGKLKSLQFDLYEDEKNYIFKGYGSGNGVGFCLQEARELAIKKLSYIEILSFFFNDIKICE